MRGGIERVGWDGLMWNGVGSARLGEVGSGGCSISSDGVGLPPPLDPNNSLDDPPVSSGYMEKLNFEEMTRSRKTK